MSSSLSKAVLFVDGYNIIGIWPLLRQKRDVHDMETARRHLIETLVDYSAFEGLDARLVFDAHYQNTPGVSETITRNVSIHYTGFGQTADTYIEKLCASLGRQLRLSQRRLIVATSDRAQQLTVTGYGAEWMSAEQLAEAVEATTRRRQRRHQPRKPSPTRFLANSLDAEAQNRLARMRMGL
ncbi:MAG: NYN domain-containing protein [Planktothrix sp. GU0601_MAG3]|nr:MAG: NYN domain-containing protein [Planktothrix sp. GU0601_MAG3]